MLDGASYFDYYAGRTDKIEGETISIPGERLDYTLREPLGVTAHVVPWNAASILGPRSIAPALAGGNTVGAKPSPEAPLSILELATVLDDTALPDGALNVVPGDGPRTGASLTGNDRVDGIVFTGSCETGKTVMKAAADNVVPVGLELGGKNPSIVFPDADLDKVVEDMTKVYFNAGQVCFVPTRLFVHEDVYDEVLGSLDDHVAKMTVGPGTENPDVGPLITEMARDRVATTWIGRSKMGPDSASAAISLAKSGTFTPLRSLTKWRMTRRFPVTRCSAQCLPLTNSRTRWRSSNEPTTSITAFTQWSGRRNSTVHTE